MYDLERFLIDFDMPRLRALAESRGVVITTSRRSEAAGELAGLLLDPLSVRTALARLQPEDREALDVLLLAGGGMRAPQFFRRFGQVRAFGPGRLLREAPWQDPANPAESLLYAGLIFRAFSRDEAGPGEFVFIPDDLCPLLPEPRAEAPTFAVQTVSPSTRWVDGAGSLVDDLFAYLVYLQLHDVRPFADGRLGKRDLAALRRRLGNAGERRLAFLQHLAGQLGFASRQGEVLRLEPAPVKRWLSAPADRQLSQLQETWRDDATWNDLCLVPALACDQETPWRNDPVATRQALLSLLARCPAGEWWSVASFVSAIKEVHPDYQRPDGDYTTWYIRDAASGDYLSGFESWDRVEGALIADLLAGVLSWLGIVALAPGEPDAICRLTGSGARLLGLMPAAPEGPPSPPIVVHPDFRVELPPPASLYTRFQLERFTDLERLEPCTYRLTTASLGRALARELQVEQLLAFLQQASQHPVPANVAGQLRLWAGRFGQISLQEVALLQVKSERVMKELSVLPETRDLIDRTLSPTSALVRKDNLPRLKKALRDLGYLPPEDTA